MTNALTDLRYVPLPDDGTYGGAEPPVHSVEVLCNNPREMVFAWEFSAESQSCGGHTCVCCI